MYRQIKIQELIILLNIILYITHVIQFFQTVLNVGSLCNVTMAFMQDDYSGFRSSLWVALLVL